MKNAFADEFTLNDYRGQKVIYKKSELDNFFKPFKSVNWKLNAIIPIKIANTDAASGVIVRGTESRVLKNGRKWNKDSKNGKIGVLATRGTLSSELFEKTSQSFFGIDIIEKDGDGIVEIIESGEFENNKLDSLLRKYLNPMIDYGIDQLVLGCTHYFIVKELIKKIVGNKITITNYNVAVAAQVKRILEEEKTINIEKNKIYNDFFTNGNKFAIELLIGNNKSVNKI